MHSSATDGFFIVAREQGAENSSIPIWANTCSNPAALSEAVSADVVRRPIDGVPGTFHLLNLLSAEECAHFIALSEALGYGPDAAVSLPRSVRHNDSVTWVVDEATEQIIWNRCKHLLDDTQGIFGGKTVLGINARFRFYRYGEGDYFGAHTDGSWPGSRVIDGKLFSDAYGDRFSLVTFLILLHEGFEGGATRFWVNRFNPLKPAFRKEDAKAVDVRTPAGSVLCFPHGTHPMHCLHSSEPVLSGTKYIIRTDLLFEI